MVEIHHSRGLVERRTLRAGLEIIDAETRRLQLTSSRIPSGIWVDRYEMDNFSPVNPLARPGFYSRPWVSATWALERLAPLDRISVLLLETRVRLSIDRIVVERSRDRPGR
jgi:hypothetical protein